MALTLLSMNRNMFYFQHCTGAFQCLKHRLHLYPIRSVSISCWLSGRIRFQVQVLQDSVHIHTQLHQVSPSNPMRHVFVDLTPFFKCFDCDPSGNRRRLHSALEAKGIQNGFDRARHHCHNKRSGVARWWWSGNVLYCILIVIVFVSVFVFVFVFVVVSVFVSVFVVVFVFVFVCVFASVLRCVALHFVVLCCAVLCCAVVCCIVMYGVVLFLL